MNEIKRTTLDKMKEQLDDIDKELDVIWYRGEHGIEIDEEKKYHLLAEFYQLNERILEIEADPFFGEADPFQPDDTQPEPEEYEIPAWLDEQQMYRQLERGEG